MYAVLLMSRAIREIRRRTASKRERWMASEWPLLKKKINGVLVQVACHIINAQKWRQFLWDGGSNNYIIVFILFIIIMLYSLRFLKIATIFILGRFLKIETLESFYFRTWIPQSTNFTFTTFSLPLSYFTNSSHLLYKIH